MKLLTEIDVEIPMRDGTVLRADIYRPIRAEPVPVLVVRTPYGKSDQMRTGLADPGRFARNGYAVVIQDCRGCFTSDGEFYPWRHEAKDGYDTVEWAALQEWSTTKVGMYGPSYLGTTQWSAAGEQPPHLVAIAPMIAPTSMRALMFRGGVFQLKTARFWTLAMGGMLAKRFLNASSVLAYANDVLSSFDNLDKDASRFPLRDWPIAARNRATDFYFDFLDRADDTAYWESSNFATFDKTLVPALIVAGWHDCCTESGAIDSYVAMRRGGGAKAARSHVKLLVGPWVHGAEFSQQPGDIDYGVRASGQAVDINGVLLRWFDYWLKGIPNGVTDEPRVRIFVMGDNVWRDEEDWPPERAETVSYYLRSGGSANSANGDGWLSRDPPLGEEPDNFEYDPDNPVPTCGGRLLRNAGPRDQSAVEARNDVLVYTGPVEPQDVEVSGKVSVTLFARSSACDTDFTAKLVDVWPDGKAYIIADGIVRARFRASENAPRLLALGETCEYTIDLSHTCNVFKAGHRIRLEISSSNFPKYDPNRNTGDAAGVDEEARIATQTVFHDTKKASRINLPLVRR